MGKVFNSFKGQIGRDAGKVFSNIVWGDKHSAPYRRVNNSTSTSRIRERRRANSDSDDFEDIQTQDSEIITRNRLDELQRQVNFNAALISKKTIPKTKESLIDLMLELSNNIETNKWKSITEEENKINNKLTDATLNKFNQCYFALKTKYASSPELDLFTKKIKEYKSQQIRQKYAFTVLIGLGVCILIGFGIYESIQEENMKKANPIESIGTKIKDIFSDLTK